MRRFISLIQLVLLTCLLCGCALRTQAQGVRMAVSGEGIAAAEDRGVWEESSHDLVMSKAILGERPHDGLTAIVSLPVPADAALLPEAWSLAECCSPRQSGVPLWTGTARQCGRQGLPSPFHPCFTPPQGGINAESQEAMIPAVTGADYVLRLRRLLC